MFDYIRRSCFHLHVFWFSNDAVGSICYIIYSGEEKKLENVKLTKRVEKQTITHTKKKKVGIEERIRMLKC